MTRRITARKVECGDVRKIVARGEIEMIKKEDRPLVLTVVRSSVSRWKRGEGGNVRFMDIHYCRHILGLRTMDFVQKRFRGTPSARD